MDVNILEIFGQVAGIGGISLGVMLLVFRDVIRKKIFPTLTKEQAYRLLRLLLILVWLVALSGIAAWVWVSTIQPQLIRAQATAHHIKPKVNGEILVVLFDIENSSLSNEIENGLKVALRRFDHSRRIRVESVDSSPTSDIIQEYADETNADLLITGLRSETSLKIQVNFNLNAEKNDLSFIYSGDFRNDNPEWYLEFINNDLNKLLALTYQLYTDGENLDPIFSLLSEKNIYLKEIVPTVTSIDGNEELRKKIDDFEYQFAKYLYGKKAPFFADKAIGVLNDIIERRNPYLPKVVLLRGKIYLHFLMFKEALQDYNKVIISEPNNWEAWYGRAKVAGILSIEDVAKESFEKAVSLNPDLKTINIQLASITNTEQCDGYSVAYTGISNGHYEKAINILSDLMKQGCDSKELIYQRAFAFLKLGKLDQAKEDFKEFLKTNPKSSEARYELGNTYVNLKKYDLAVYEYTLAIDYFLPFEISKTHKTIKINEVPKLFLEQIYHNLGWASEKSGDDDNAIINFEFALKLMSGARAINTNVSLGQIYARKKRFDDSVVAFDRALKHAPGHPQILQLKQDSLKKSLDIFE